MQLEKRHQVIIASLLGMLILATHGHHFATALHLPPATWVVFFLAGFYLRSARMFGLLLAEVVLLDYVATTVGGVDAFCISPAYGFLLPAYGSLWIAGKWYANRYTAKVQTLPVLGVSLVGGVALAEVFSSGGFYFFSGRFADTSLTEFAVRLVKYFPYSLQSFGFWMSVAIIVHVAFSLKYAGKHQSS